MGDSTAPTVSSINRADASPTSAASVNWTVTFSESVTGVNAADFALANGGLGGTPAITGVTGSGTTYTVTASTGTGSGTLGLNLVDDDSIADTAGNKLGGTGAGNGNFTGQVYTIDRSAPSVTLSGGASGTTNVAAHSVTAHSARPSPASLPPTSRSATAPSPPSPRMTAIPIPSPSPSPSTGRSA